MQNTSGKLTLARKSPFFCNWKRGVTFVVANKKPKEFPLDSFWFFVLFFLGGEMHCPCLKQKGKNSLGVKRMWL